MLSASELPTGATFEATTGAFAWTPDYSQAGAHTVTFSAKDASLTDSKGVVIDVSDTNRAPTLTVPGAQTAKVGSALSFSVSGTDPDGSAVTLSATGRPDGATFNADTGAFAWTPGAEQTGSHTITFHVSDGMLSAEGTVEVTVEATNSAQPPASCGGCSGSGAPLSTLALALLGLLACTGRRRFARAEVRVD